MGFAYGDPVAEQRALERLAAWSRRWAPATRTDGVDGIALDVTGCAHLWGGETAMLAAMEQRLAAMGLTGHLAVAPNLGAAHALARHVARPARPAVVGSEGLEAALEPLPVSALRLHGASITVLARLGLKTVGLLAGVPRAALKRRFGARRKQRDPRDDTYDDYLGRTLDRSDDVLARLDEALGRVVVPLDAARPVPPASIMHGLSEPVMEAVAVLACARPLIARLMLMLERRERGVRVLRLEAFRTDGGRSEALLRLSRPTRDVVHVMTLLGERLDGWRAEFGYDALAAQALETVPLGPGQTDAMRTALEDRVDPGLFVDRLRARLGDHVACRALARASHWPERSEAWLPIDVPVAFERSWALPSMRPERLLDPPEEVRVVHGLPEGPPKLFVWRRVPRNVARIAGPERIAPEWWRERGTARARDYYRVETSDAERVWLFREGFDGDGRNGVIRWFVHGVFS